MMNEIEIEIQSQTELEGAVESFTTTFVFRADEENGVAWPKWMKQGGQQHRLMTGDVPDSVISELNGQGFELIEE
jgi:hypothetical protein